MILNPVGHPWECAFGVGRQRSLPPHCRRTNWRAERLEDAIGYVGFTAIISQP